MAGAEDMADRAYLRLGTRSENQAVVFLYVFPVSRVAMVQTGGDGKSEGITRLILL